MTKWILSAFAAVFLSTGFAARVSAAPAILTDNQMDHITAGEVVDPGGEVFDPLPADFLSVDRLFALLRSLGYDTSRFTSGVPASVVSAALSHASVASPGLSQSGTFQLGAPPLPSSFFAGVGNLPPH